MSTIEMSVYFVERNWVTEPRVHKTLAGAQKYLSESGYVQKQPRSDLYPEVQCWWKGDSLARIIPLDFHE